MIWGVLFCFYIRILNVNEKIADRNADRLPFLAVRVHQEENTSIVSSRPTTLGVWEIHQRFQGEYAGR